MNSVKPTKHEDGKETVTLFGTTVDVTGIDEFRLFKTDYTVDRPKEKKAKKAKETKGNE